MTKDVITVPAELPLARARAMMKELRIRHLPVVQVGRLVGILSDRDILARADAPGASTVCGEVMTPEPITVTRGTTVSDMARTMINRKIDALPVVDANHHVVGLVTATDLLELLVEPNETNVLPFEFHVRPVTRSGSFEASA